jgi:hypothetical protein
VPLQEIVKDNELDKVWYMNFDGAFLEQERVPELFFNLQMVK